VKHQPSFANGVERGAVCHALVVTHYRDCAASVVLEPDYFSFHHTSDRRTRQASTTANEPLPVIWRPERALDTRRRDFEHVLATEHRARVEARLDGARRAGAIVHGHFLSVTPIDANVKYGLRSRTATPDLDEIEPQRIKLGNYNLLNVLQRLVHVVSRYPPRTKKCGEPSPTFR
jgi:hypothetical protein